jgi:hypothetical protein
MSQWVVGGMLIAAWVIAVSERASAVFVAIIAVATLVAVREGVGVGRNGGLHETPDGIANRHTLGYKRWVWDDIDKFTHVRRHVYVLQRDRKMALLTGVAEGGRNAWDDGETREITSLLNDRLAYWQAHALRPASEECASDGTQQRQVR